MKKPKFTFLIPVLNAERHIERCLGSIRAQDYPRDDIEIILLDGGCTDSTIGIAKAFAPRIYPNPRGLAEYGLQEGMKYATGDLIVIFAADNELHSRDWLKRAAAAFEGDKECSAVWGPLRSGIGDPPINRYFELIQNDPMTSFMNRNLESYLKSAHTAFKDGSFYFRVDPARPLVWGANGLTARRERVAHIWAQKGYLGDNDAFQRMIEEGNNMVAYIPELVTYHHHVGEVGDWVKKWKRNFSRHFLANLETRNTNWLFAGNFRLRLFLWLIYSTNPLISGADATYRALRDRNIYWFYHPLLCFLQTFVYTYITLMTEKGRAAVFRIAKGEMQTTVSGGTE